MPRYRYQVRSYVPHLEVLMLKFILLYVLNRGWKNQNFTWKNDDNDSNQNFVKIHICGNYFKIIFRYFPFIYLKEKNFFCCIKNELVLKKSILEVKMSAALSVDVHHGLNRQLERDLHTMTHIYHLETPPQDRSMKSNNVGHYSKV